MAYIYKITNLTNGKIYIGKTSESIEKRWKQHIRDSKKRKNEKRPLYDAMNKYGINNFKIETIEETSIPDKREVYWISFYNSYHNGYNATLGGDGKTRINYDLVINTYNKLKSQKLVAEKLGIDGQTVRRILKEKNIPIIKNIPGSKKITQYDLEYNFIKNFNSAGEAAREIILMGLSKSNISTSVGNRIRDCANGKLKTAYGFIWKFYI